MKDKGHGDVRGSPGGHGTMHGGCSLGVQQPQPRDLPSPHPMQDKHYWLLPRVSQPSRSPVPRLGDEPPASLHLHVQTSLHAAHLHVFVQVPVHVVLGRGQLQLPKGDGAEINPGHAAEQSRGQGQILQGETRSPPFPTLLSLPPPHTSIWSMVSWYSFSRLLNNDSVSLITFSRLSSCCWGEQKACLEAGKCPA